MKNDLSEHNKIPSENALSEKFNLSRATVRQGINKLKSEGLIYSKKGSGNFVSSKKIEYTISPYTTFTKEILKANKEPSMDFLEVKIIDADELISKKLSIHENEKVLYVKNVRYVNKIPFLYAEYYINHLILKGIEDLISKTESISELYINTYNINPIRDNSEIEIMGSDDCTKNIFKIQNDLPIIKISTSTSDEKTQQPIDYCYSYFRSDMAKIVINYKDGVHND
jgi:DNA-binding GntR family transcriptional regulator